MATDGGGYEDDYDDSSAPVLFSFSATEVPQKSRNVVPRGPGSHFIGCRAFLDAGAAAQVVQRCADQCWHRIRLMQYRVVQKDRAFSVGGSSEGIAR